MELGEQRGASERLSTAERSERLSTAERSERLSTAERLALVELVAERLAGSRDVAEVAAVVASTVKDAIGATAMLVATVSDDHRCLLTVRAEGFSDPSGALVAEPIELDDTMPATVVLEECRPLFWTTLDERNRAFPKFSGFPSENQSWAILPLAVRNAALGVLVLGWRQPGRFRPSDKALLGAVAHQCALAVDWARIDDERRAERETLELLSEGTRLMVSALEPERVLASLVRLAVPRLAPWCAVYVAEGRRLRRVAVAIDRDGELAEELRSVQAIDVDAAVPLARAFRSGVVQVVPVVTEDIIRRVYGEPLAARVMAAQGGPRQLTSVNVPIRAGGQVIGAMSLVSGAWHGSPTAQVLFAAEGLAGRAGVALVNARRFEHERATSALLTQALLPPSVPPIPGYEVATKYLPAGSQVAGDWFDVTRLPSGDYLVGVGDAGGHGIAAAALMAQLRNGARALAFDGARPGRLLRCLTQLAADTGEDSFATALYAVLQAGSGSIVWASCGHLPPLRYRDGEAAYVEHRIHPPLGWPAGDEPPEHEMRLEPGDAVVLVTDGVVERRGSGLTEGMDGLRSAVAMHGALDAAQLAERVIDSMSCTPDDDCCVVVLSRR